MKDVELVEIKRNEAFEAWRMQKKCFKPLYQKYRDKDSPYKNGFLHFKKIIKSPKVKTYWITYDCEKVGEIFIAVKETKNYLARIFVLPKFQNRGIAQAAIMNAENIHSNTPCWSLDTIKQEEKNCYLYEKLGYRRTGKEKIINDKMTIVYYEK